MEFSPQSTGNLPEHRGLLLSCKQVYQDSNSPTLTNASLASLERIASPQEVLYPETDLFKCALGRWKEERMTETLFSSTSNRCVVGSVWPVAIPDLR